MVYLNRIYTRSGDDGQTGLGDGTRIAKTHPRIVAYGGVDELNALIGVCLTSGVVEQLRERLLRIQNDLFDLGADLCVPESDETAVNPRLRITEQQVVKLERWIDEAVAELKPLASFVLPGGTPSAAHLHHARTVCRRVEISVLQLAEFEDVNPQVNIYLNRLSDLLFVLARLCNDKGERDVLWVPGQNQD
jgi:cob(I)alamin adenosyltransferase